MKNPSPAQYNKAHSSLRAWRINRLRMLVDDQLRKLMRKVEKSAKEVEIEQNESQQRKEHLFHEEFFFLFYPRVY